VICAYYIGEKIIDIDFSCFLAKNRKKAKYERLLAKRETPLANMGLRRNIRNAYENVLCPLAKADKSLLPIRMDKTFRRNIELQIDSLARHSLYRDIRVADLSPGQKIGFRTWEDDGREWREAELECCALERLISAKNSEVEHEIYRKHACLRVLQSRHVQTVDCGNGKKTFYAGKAKVICPSCGAEVTLSSQQVVMRILRARIQTDFYDWQTEVFEIYEHIGNNLRKFLLLLGCMTVLFLSEFLCLYLIGYRGCVLRVDDFFQNDRTYAVVKQLIAVGVLVKSLGYAGSEVVFRIKLNIEKDCPSCGANFIPDEKHCCSFCGYSLDADNAKWVVLTADKKQGGSL